MSDDLVSRLRRELSDSSYLTDLLDKAASEIERLRALVPPELREIEEECVGITIPLSEYVANFEADMLRRK